MMTALLLARAGVESACLKQNTSTTAHRRLWGCRAGLRRSTPHRLIDRIMGGSLPVEGRSLGIWAKSLVGDEYGRVPLAALHSEFTPCKTLHCPQTWTEKVLSEALSQEPVADVRLAARLSRSIPGRMMCCSG